MDTAAGAAGALLWSIWSVMCCFGYLVPIAIGIFSMVLWIFAIIDVAQRRPSEFPHALKGETSSNEQIIWVLVVVLAGIIGAIIYYFAVMRPHPRSKAATDVGFASSPAAAPPASSQAPNPSAPPAAPAAAAPPEAPAIPPEPPSPGDSTQPNE